MFEKESAEELLSKLIENQSITPDQTNCQDEITRRLEEIGFECEEFIFSSVELYDNKPVKNLWAHIGKEPYLVFCGHTDVVPAGNENLWTSDPFKASIRNGAIYGRGAADMKGSIAAMITALSDWLAENSAKLPLSDLEDTADKDSKAQGIALLITGDEEGYAVDGTQRVLEELAKRGTLISQCLVGEPTCTAIVGDTIKNGRRGSLTLAASFTGQQGHAAYISKDDNLVHRTHKICHELLATDWDAGIDASPPGTSFNIVNIGTQSPAENVSAYGVSLLCNWRYAPQMNIAKLKTKVEGIIKDQGFVTDEDLSASDASDIQKLRYKIDWRTSALPYLSQAGQLIHSLQDAIMATTGKKAELSSSGGTSDGRFFPQYNHLLQAHGNKNSEIEIAEFGPLNTTIHQVDEHLMIKDLESLVKIYYKFLIKHFS